MLSLLVLSICASAFPLVSQDRVSHDLGPLIDAYAAAAEDKIVAWRRHIHQFPELGNKENGTAALVAAELQRLGLEVRTQIAVTGVVGILRGATPGDVVALRADMDGLPVKEETGLPFASQEISTWEGETVPVMHACGHDTHVAMLLGAAEVLTQLKSQLVGTVMFVFQPAEEGTETGTGIGGAELMLQEGLFDDPTPTAIFGQHIGNSLAAGEAGWVSGPAMASTDTLLITVVGVQTHAAYPWQGVDALYVASLIVPAIEAIPGRRVDVRNPSVVTVGVFSSGSRNNIIPESATLKGTVRSLDTEQRYEIHSLIQQTALGIGAAYGANVTVEIIPGYPVTYNDPALTQRMVPTLERVAGEGKVSEEVASLGGEDFAYYAQQIPGLFFWIGGRDPAVPPENAIPNHSPYFDSDERALVLGTRFLSHLAVDYLML